MTEFEQFKAGTIPARVEEWFLSNANQATKAYILSLVLGVDDKVLATVLGQMAASGAVLCIPVFRERSTLYCLEANRFNHMKEK